MNAPAPRSNVLKGTQISCMLPVIDIERARRFYGEQLGLEPVGAKASGKFVYRCGGTEVALFPKAGGTKATHSGRARSEEHTSELQSLRHLVCRLLLEKKKKKKLIE